METMIRSLNLSSSVLVVSITLVILLVIKSTRKPKNMPPGPPRLPLIGHLHLLAGKIAHQALTKINQKYGPVVSLKLGEVDAVVIASREVAKDVMKTQDPAFANRSASISVQILWYNYADLSFAPYGDFWRQMRKISVLELLSAKNVKSFGYIRQDEISHMVESLRSSAGQAVDLTAKMSSTMCNITCRSALGKGVKDRDALINCMNTALNMAGGFEIADLFPTFKFLHLFSIRKYKLLRMRGKLDSILDQAVEEHRTAQNGEYGGEDVVEVFLRMQKTGELKFPITTENIKAIILDMFTAGTETNSTVMVWMMTEMMRQPRILTKLQDEIRSAFKGKTTMEERDLQGLKYMKLVIKESLRLHPIVPIISRECRDEDRIVGGYTIPKRTRVAMNVYSMQRDPKYWKDPETFYPERFEESAHQDFLGNDFDFLPFGAGKRICPGMTMGLSNIEYMMSQLLYHFDWNLPKGMTPADVDVIELGGLTTARKNPVLLIPTPYNPPN